MLGLEGAPRERPFVNCFKTTARIKNSCHEASFSAVAPVALQLCFFGDRDVNPAQITFFENHENISKIYENHSNSLMYDNLKHSNI